MARLSSWALILGLATTACIGSVEEMDAQATQHANALASDLHGDFQYVALPGTECHEFETLSFREQGAYVAKLTSGALEQGTFTVSSAGRLRLKPTKGGTRYYGMKTEEAAIELTRKSCSETLEQIEDAGCASDVDCDPGFTCDGSGNCIEKVEPKPSPDVEPACAERSGGALVTFQVKDELLHIWSTNREFIDTAKSLVGTEQRTPMFERVISGHDACTGREWSVDPERMSFTDFAVEVCDGLPSHIDGHLEVWLERPGYYCPWSPKIISVEER